MNSVYLEVVAALAVIFAIVASMVAAVNSFVIRLLSIKAKVLWSALANVLDKNQGAAFDLSLPATLRLPFEGRAPKVDKPAQSTTEHLANHALVQTLGKPNRLTDRSRVDFIPKGVLSAALADLGQDIDPLTGLTKAVAGTALAPVVAAADKDIASATAAVEQWFDGYMSRISELYAIAAKKILFIVGLILAVAFNVNAIGLTSQLLTHADQRSALIGSVSTCTAEKPADCADDAVKELHEDEVAIHLPVVGRYESPGHALDAAKTNTDDLLIILGWMITGFAVSSGAPFWFDIAKRLSGVRKGS